MKYKITEQYLKGEEKVIAACLTLSDAYLFIHRKSFDTQEDKQKIIYRLYEEEELIQIFNQEKSSLYPAKYAENDAELENGELLSLSVIHKDEYAIDRKNIANFAHESDAEQFIMDKYRHDPEIKKSACYRPTPLATRPVPPGFPVNCWVEEEEVDKLKKNDH